MKHDSEKHHLHTHHLAEDIHCNCGHCHVDNDDEHEEHEEEVSLKKIIISFILFAFGMLFELRPTLLQNIIAYENVSCNTLFKLVFFFVSYVIIARSVIKGSIINILHGKIFDEQFLMSLASIGALCLGQAPEAVAVMLFYQIGEYFEDFAVDKSKDSINKLMEICPNRATIIKNGMEIEVPAEKVQIEDIIIVKPGERVPVDGILIEGKSFIDNSAITGESVPQEVLTGNIIYSGAINTSSVIKLRTLHISTESAAARIINLALQSSKKKTKTERFITRFSSVYTPIVCLLALLVALIPPIVIGLTTSSYEWSKWIYRALSFLVVSCPCAIVISVPLTFFGGIGSCSKKGILVKGSSSIENLCNLKTAVFDKTGTLTKGSFTVTEVHSVNPDILPEDELIALASHAETYSNHPVAKSLKQAHIHNEACTIANVSNAQEIGGQGIKAVIDGKTILAGNKLLMTNNNVNDFKPLDESQKQGTTVYLSIDGTYMGYIVISDTTKQEAKDSIARLKKLGISNITMLTGDDKSIAEVTAKELNIQNYYANLLPEDKVNKVEELLSQLEQNGKKKGTLAFVGDGINDAPVLSRADIGIAMGALGTDAAIESADVVIMTDEISKIEVAVRSSKKTLGIVYQNIIFSLGIKCLIMILSSVGITNMWVAVFGDVGVSILAILNAIRALR